LTTIAGIVSVLLVAVGLFYTNEANRNQQAVAVAQQKLAERGQVTERFSKAIDQLGQEDADRLAIRLGGVYALERLMRDSPEDEPNIIAVLCAFVRIHASTPAGADRPMPASSPADVQASVTVLARRPYPTAPANSVLDLTGSRLSMPAAALPGATLAGASLLHANLAGSNMRGSDLSSADLSAANLRRADLSQVNLSDAYLTHADLTQANLRDANLRRARLGQPPRVDLPSAQPESPAVNLGGAYLDRADLTSAYLVEANLFGTHMTDAELRGADLDGAYLGAAELNGADLSGARLAGAKLPGADLHGANLSGADLRAANLFRTNLSGVDLSGAILDGADLSMAEGLVSGQLRGARVDDHTKLPAGIAKPSPVPSQTR